jgi:hypothetical protein
MGTIMGTIQDAVLAHGLVQQTEIEGLKNVNADLLKALEDLLTYDRVVRPAFRSMPVGAPNSQARLDQDKLIAVEDAALAAIKRAKAS